MLVLSEHTATGSAHVSSSDRAAEVVRDLCGVRAREISCRLPPPYAAPRFHDDHEKQDESRAERLILEFGRSFARIRTLPG